MTTTDVKAPQQMPQRLLLTLTAMVVGSMVGAGVFALRDSRRPRGCSARWSPG